MRIGFDCAPLVIAHSPGIRRVVENALRALEARGNVQVVRLMPPDGVRLRTWRAYGLARSARELKLQGLHAFQSAFCTRSHVPSVQTVHELSWLHGVREKGAWKQKLWVARGRRRAAAVVCATGFSARDYAGASAHGPEPTVIPWGVSEIFDSQPRSHDAATLAALSLTDVPFVLSPGGLRAKKRPLDLVRALAATAAPSNGHLVITAFDRSKAAPVRALADRLGLQDRVHVLQNLPDSELATLYRHARTTAVISHSEGFALPVLESLACGTRPIVTDHSAQSEVAGEHAHSVPRGDADALRRALNAAFEARAPTAPAGVEHARAFTWDRTAQAIEQLWETLV
jgi:glycosyltransferase involved in cell wall biosynthesis